MLVEYVPAGQGMQTEAEVAPTLDENVPAPHCIQLEEPTLLE